MTPAARVQAAIGLLDEIFAGAPAEKALTGWARRARFAGSKDRAAVRDHVFDALRRRVSALPEGADETGRNLMLGLLAQDGADIAALFGGAGYGPPALEPQEGALLADIAGPGARPDIPAWIAPLLQGALAGEMAAVIEAMRHRAPVFLRVNLARITRDSAVEALAREEISTRISTLSDSALEVVAGARRIAASSPYRDGLVELQDASSQAAVESLPLAEGMRILDYCAGGGGKTLAMGGRVRADFFAHDAHAARMRDLPVRAERARLRVSLLEALQLKVESPFDLVFCDVPCSGSGTWRRTPDAKWRFSRPDLDSLLALQQKIVQQAEGLVSHDGVLAYATCSLLREENEDQVARFLSERPDWQCLSLRRWSPVDGCDGFFLAQLTRKA
ncbi:RsmB/NOP family class I SAM-dependent RNA methyltransferase [Shimia sp.]|uniref:RsmB/NOP family class I SAM-dependent RNA methyltransferase n=1 Tax=Shimia sp. TaxID=1954381 RepID=UPI0035646A3F